MQAEALEMRTLREVEPLAERQVAGPKGSACGACCAAVEQHLHEQAYSQQVPLACRRAGRACCTWGQPLQDGIQHAAHRL